MSLSSCYGESSARALIDGWDDYFRTDAVVGRLKNDLGMTNDQMDSAATCHRYANIEDDLISSLRSPPDGRFPDRPKDPLPPLMTSSGSPNLLVPLKWILDNYDKPELETFTTVGPSRYMVSCLGCPAVFICSCERSKLFILVSCGYLRHSVDTIMPTRAIVPIPWARRTGLQRLSIKPTLIWMTSSSR